MNFFLQAPYNPYQLQHNPQMFGMPGPISTNVFPNGQVAPSPLGNTGPRAIQGIAAPGAYVLPYSRPTVSGATTEIIPMSPAPYLTGMFVFFIYLLVRRIIRICKHITCYMIMTLLNEEDPKTLLQPVS